MASNEKKIKIVVDKSGAQRALGAVQGQLKSVGLRAEGLDASFAKLKGAAGVLTGVAAAIGVAITSTTAYATATARAVVEVDNMARNARVSIDTFQAMSSVTEKLGIDSQALADILQDTSDRIGEFTRTGKGEFKDVYEQYIKPMGVTIGELRTMKPDEVLNLIKKGMDEAGASANEMNSVFEQVASNSGRLIPALDGTGQSINRIKDAMDRDGKLITQDDVDKARELDSKSKELDKTWASIKTEIGLSAAGPATSFLTFLDNSLKKLKSMNQELSEISKKIGDNSSMNASAVANLPGGSNTGFKTNKLGNKDNTTFADTLAGFGYKDQTASNEEMSGTGGGKGSDSAAKALADLKQQASEYIDAINQRNMDEFDLLDSKLTNEKSRLDEYRSAGALSESEHKSAMLALEQSYADSLYEIMFNEDVKEAELAAKKKEREKKDAADKAKMEASFNNQIMQGNMSIAKESLALIGDTAKEGSALRIAAMIAEKGIAASQVFMQYEVAAAMAMAQLGPIAGAPIAATMKTQAMISMGLIAAQGVASLASRQGGGNMSGTYQTGGGAHTSSPEMFTDRITGKSYMTGNGNMTPAHQLKQGGSGGNQPISISMANYGEQSTLTTKGDYVDDAGVRRIMLEMTPEIMSREAGNPSSQFNQSRGTIEKIQPEFN